jgi:hypothetical protein
MEHMAKGTGLEALGRYGPPRSTSLSHNLSHMQCVEGESRSGQVESGPWLCELRLQTWTSGIEVSSTVSKVLGVLNLSGHRPIATRLG